MNRPELLRRLRRLADQEGELRDCEDDHLDADRALLAYIDDDEITAAFDAIGKWYA